MIGQRWDLDITELLDFNNPDWESHLRSTISEHGCLHPPSGVDYYLFPRGLFVEIPPFAIGRTAYDNWLIFKARSLDVPVIDATSVVTNIHQNHDRTYTSVGLEAPNGIEDLTTSVEAEHNLELAGGAEHGFTLEHATWTLTSEGIRRALTLRHLYFRLEAAPVLFSYLHFLRSPMKMLTRLIIYIRSMIGVTQN